MIAIMSVLGKSIKKATLERIKVAKQLGGSAEESLSAIKLVVSFG